ncbi:DNAH6 [Symbiodinium sp. CCMP2592]|nr:DNAH6 [Symbiodinium sp. CCMP2592]
MPSVGRSGIQSLLKSLGVEGQWWPQTPRQAPAHAPGANPGRQTSQKDKSQLKKALRNRGGAAEVNSNNGALGGAGGVRAESGFGPGLAAALPSISKDTKEVTSKGRASDGTSRERRPSWAPSATSLVEGAVVQMSRMVEAVRAAGPEYPAPVVAHGDQLCQSLQRELSHQLSTWFNAFATQKYDGRVPPRLTSLVRRGEAAHHRLQATLVWRGLEIHAELQLLPGSAVAVADAWTEVLSDGFADALASALASTRNQPLEALLEALLEAEAESDDEMCEEPSFSTWLDGRAPLLRFGKWERKAWDFPPSREEKTELLILHLLSSSERPAEVSPARRSPRYSCASSARG